MTKRMGVWCIVVAFAAVCNLAAQSVTDPKASYIDVAQRHAELQHNHDPRIAQAIASLKSAANFRWCPRPPDA